MDNMKEEDKIGYFIAGFVEGEGSFGISLNNRPDLKLQYEVRPTFCVAQTNASRNIIELIQKTLGLQETIKIHTRFNHLCGLMCQNKKHLYERVVPFFEKYQLMGEKKKNFDIWKQAVKIKYQGIKTREDLDRVLALRRQINPKGKKRNFCPWE